ncbi:MAG TPA: sugar phosphate isomerase/epimerase [Armatimonadota bacterium]|nr:sugar phosphate isomerase/epimerase [Armatimonadota bacterium]
MTPVAVNLYTVREECEQDVRGTVEEIAGLGFKGVEYLGFHGLSVEVGAKLLSGLGLEARSGFLGNATPETVDQIVADCNTLGTKYVIGGFGPDDMKTMDAVKACAASLQQSAELLGPHGITFAFHNHWWEFDEIDGTRIYDCLMDLAPDVMSELDVYWAALGGTDPVEVLGKYGDRIPLIHAKDGPLTGDPSDPHTAAGKGRMDLPAIIAATDDATLEWVVVELDHCATDMMTAVRDSYNYLTSHGLAEGKV